MLQDAERVADGIWERVVGWDKFAKDVVGGQLARAVDSIGANMAEAFGRYHYGEKLRFLYYARGSLYETKYWLNRASTRNLMPIQEVDQQISQLSGLARQLNAFIKYVKSRRSGQASHISEASTPYTSPIDDSDDQLLKDNELNWLDSPPPSPNPPN